MHLPQRPARLRPSIHPPRRLHRWARRRGSDDGSSTVELVLLTPLLIGLFLFVIMCGRLVSVQLDVDAAAHDAARAASIARTTPAATADAMDAAMATLTARNRVCTNPTITVDTGGLRPGGVVTVTIACHVPLSDLALLNVGGTRTVTSSAASPIDVYRGGSP